MDILSPLPGTFYKKASPDEPDFKTPGDEIAVGDTVGLIEVMKSFISIFAEVEGIFKGYVVENETPVSPGQLLAEVE